VEEVERLEELGRLAQDDDDGQSAPAVRELQERYPRWYAAALSALPDDLSERFQALYRGGPVNTKIKSFVQNPRMRWVLYPRMPKFLKRHGPWQYALDSSFLIPLREQKQLLLMAMGRAGLATEVFKAFDQLSVLSRRLAPALAILEREKRGRQGFPLHDEYDLQRVLHALLVLQFDDVRPEEATPSKGGGSYRIDFVLSREKVAVEAKMTRSSLTDRQVRDQLVSDIFGYKQHAGVSAFFAVVYDPGRQIDNPQGFERDFEDHDPEFPIRVVVAHG
jgi:hypothetical protein